MFVQLVTLPPAFKVSVMEGGVIADCTNAGKIDITVNVDKGFIDQIPAGAVVVYTTSKK